MDTKLGKLISKIKTSREIKGKEIETLNLIEDALKLANQNNDFESIVELHWEAALCWQHVVMNELAKEESEQDAYVMDEAREHMAERAIAAHEIIQKKNLQDLLPRSFRFLGRVSDYSDDYDQSIDYYKEALSLFRSDAFTILEVRAFMAYSTVMKGEVERGMQMALDVYKDLKESELGKRLKEENYVDWTLWLTGIPTRQVFALKKIGAKYDKKEMKKWLNEVKHEIESPTGDVSWGDVNFEFRMTEIKKALSLLSAVVYMSSLIFSRYPA